MTYSVVVSSRTGNTKMLADIIVDFLSDKHCIYSGPPDSKASEADIIFTGFGTDKGCCDESISSFLKSLNGKKIFLFGTSGFGQSPVYFNQIFDRVKALVPSSCTVIGTYMCQGKMPAAVRSRYEMMLEKNPEDKNAKIMIDNFDTALSHPNQQDFDGLIEILKTLSI